MNDNTNENVQDISEILQVRREKLAELVSNGENPYTITKYKVDASAKEIIENYNDFEGKTVSLAGRIMSKRGMGKATFCDISDRDGKIQLYIRKDGVGINDRLRIGFCNGRTC